MGDSRGLYVHLALGGGAVADLLLWKNWCQSVAFLVSSTALWFLFEIAGYNLLSFMSNVLLLLVVIFYFWAKSASLLNRPLPPLPNLEISEEAVVKASDGMRSWANNALSVAHDIAVGGNLVLFAKVDICLSTISYIGSFFNLLTLIYICILLSLSFPVLYDKYQNRIDENLRIVCNVVEVQCRKFDDLLQKVPWLSSRKRKKIH